MKIGDCSTCNDYRLCYLLRNQLNLAVSCYDKEGVFNWRDPEDYLRSVKNEIN